MSRSWGITSARKPANRVLYAVWWALLVWNVIGIGIAIAAGSMVILVDIFGVLLWGWLILDERKVRREYRRSSGDSGNPNLSAYSAAAYSAAAYNALAAAQGTSTSLTEQDEVPVARQEYVPILARKGAFLVRTGQGFAFTGLTDQLGGQTYGVDENAVCARQTVPLLVTQRDGTGRIISAFYEPPIDPHPGEEAPVWGCTCGFYAVLYDTEAFYSIPNSAVLLDVQFSGKVIVYTGGYRAQHQQVLSVKVPPACHGCGCKSEQLFIDSASNHVIVGCDSCVYRSAEEIVIEEIGVSLGIPVAWGEYSEIQRFLGS